ncbi:SCP domain-containing protein [Plasmodiophora brassicae]|uniref:SCP domain-containing protein n=1 Tax=Plasmodiophora brassicae TaxID=37360 RepID=A0A0G4IUB3_PLABS|nr:hypothetical protein PBRA_006843 [Plasmodiophora brassicae]SPR00869.1 unnamed protein product [Plasmodiophora brassicae]
MLAIVAAAAVAVLLGVSCGELSAADKRELVAWHNYYRSRSQEVVAQGGQGATAMMAVQWDDALAADAQQWANLCLEEHARGIHNGENIAFATPTNSFVFMKLVDFWFTAEGSRYNFQTTQCQANYECSHWRQLMWAQVTRIGCAMRTCSGLKVLNTFQGDELVCRYDVAPVRAMRPFEAGPVCSRCPAGHQCTSNLCTPAGTQVVLPDAIPDYIKQPVVMNSNVTDRGPQTGFSSSPVVQAQERSPTAPPPSAPTSPTSSIGPVQAAPLATSSSPPPPANGTSPAPPLANATTPAVPAAAGVASPTPAAKPTSVATVRQ